MSVRRGACGVAASFFFSVVKVAASFRSASLGLQRLYSGTQLHFRISSVILTSIRPLQREGARAPLKKSGSISRLSRPSLLAPSKLYRLIDFYDLILMIPPPAIVNPSDPSAAAGWLLAAATALGLALAPCALPAVLAGHCDPGREFSCQPVDLLSGNHGGRPAAAC
jgi:hypothetical protein